MLPLLWPYRTSPREIGGLVALGRTSVTRELWSTEGGKSNPNKFGNWIIRKQRRNSKKKSIVESFPNSAWSFGGCCKLSAVSSRIYAHLNVLSQLSNNLLSNKFPLMYHLRLWKRVNHAYATAEPGKAAPEADL